MTSWNRIAKLLKETLTYTPPPRNEVRCRLCHEVISPLEDHPMRVLSRIYRHFKEKHPHKLEEARRREITTYE
jgi:hypothetical protein